MTGIAEIKAAARKAAFATRKGAFARGQGQAAEILADFLAAHATRPLSGYMPMRTEIDPLPAMVAHLGPVCVPVIIGPGQALKFRQWTPETPMTPGGFGALIPAEGPMIDPQIVIVPLLSFDARGYRLGYGGGFYDRTLQGLRERGKVVAVGFAFSTQEVSEVPIEPTDQRLDAVITELGVTRFL